MLRPDQVCEFRGERVRGAAAVPLQPALESGARIFGAVEGELVIGQPLVGGDLLRPTAFPPPPSRPCCLRDPSRNRSAVWPVRPRTMIAADRAGCLSSPRSCGGNRRAGSHARLAARATCRRWLRVSNSTIGNACAAAAAPRARDARDPRASASVARRRYRRQARRSCERRAHQHDRAKHIGPEQRAPGRDRGAEIMPDHGGDRAIAECRYQAERVAHQIG